MINFSDKFFYPLIFAVLLISVGFGYAYVLDGSGDPSVMGHSSGEIENLCLSNGTNCDFLANASTGSVSLVQDDCYWRALCTDGHSCGGYYENFCDVGDYVTGISARYQAFSHQSWAHSVYCCKVA